MAFASDDSCPWPSWKQDLTLWRPAEALSLLPWGRIHHCPSKASSACCIALREACLPLIVILLQWMKDCALYVARTANLVKTVREFTEDQNCCHVIALPKLPQWQLNKLMVLGPSKTLALFWTLYTAVVCAPRLFHPMYTPKEAPIKPYVYIYRGVDKKISLERYVSPNLSSWTLCKQVARQFAGPTGLVLQLRLTADIAALNLHCLPYDVSGIPGNVVSTTPCKHQAWDPVFSSLSLKDRDLLLKLQQSGLLLPPSVSLGHVSHYPTEYEVLVQPLLLHDIRAIAPLDPTETLAIYEPRRVQTLTVHKGTKPGSLKWTVDTAVEINATRCKDFLGPSSDPHIQTLLQQVDQDIPHIG